MPQTKDKSRTGNEEQEALKALSNIYVIKAFEEICEEDVIAVWKTLDTPTKAHLRRMVAIEQLHAEGHL